MKDFIEASAVYDFLTALGVEDVHTVRSVQIEPDRVMVRVSHNRLHEDGGLLVSDHSVRIQYDDPKRADAAVRCVTCYDEIFHYGDLGWKHSYERQRPHEAVPANLGGQS